MCDLSGLNRAFVSEIVVVKQVQNNEVIVVVKVGDGLFQVRRTCGHVHTDSEIVWNLVALIAFKGWHCSFFFAFNLCLIK